MDLSQPSHTRLDFVSEHISLDNASILLVMGSCVGTRADKRHLALENIEQLGQFIQRRSP